MRQGMVAGLLGLMLGASTTALAQSGSGAAADCTKLKSKERSACEAKSRAEAAAQKDGSGQGSVQGSGEMPTTGVPDPQSGEMPTKGVPDPPRGDMPTAGVPDPPPESMKPMRPSGAGSLPPDAPRSGSSSGSSSSSSSSSSPADAIGTPENDDVAPTKAGGDTPVNASSLKDLGSRADSTKSRAKLEETRVEDDLKVGRFYFKDGNYAGATARYQDALQHDPENPEAHFGLAQVLLKQNKRQDAIGHLQRYVQLAPDDEHTKEAQKLLAKLGPSR